MATVNQIDGDVIVRGGLRVTGSLTGCADSITDAMVESAAGLDASKLEHNHRAIYAQESATTTTSGAWTMHVVAGATGTLKSFAAGTVVLNIGAATVTVDLLKNGVSILTAAFILDSSNTAYILEAGTLSSTSVVVGDVLEVKTTAAADGGTVSKGFFAVLDLYEDAA